MLGRIARNSLIRLAVTCLIPNQIASQHRLRVRHRTKHDGASALDRGCFSPPLDI